MSSELDRVELLRAVFAASGASAEGAVSGASDGVLMGIGDDAAVLSPSADPLVWTIDAAVEGSHFRRDLLPLEDIGYRSTMAAASDLAAMGADPVALLSALVLPAGFSDDDLVRLAEGQRSAAAEIGAPIAGGNMARGGELSITTTALGRAARPLRRDGARAGDVLWLAGPVGLAAGGLRLLERRAPLESEAAKAAVLAWRRPIARIAAGIEARAMATAAIDISDGLARDAGHLARSSRARLVLDPAAIITPLLRAAANELEADPLELSLHGGEDYALLIAAAPGSVLAGFKRVGYVAELEGAPSAVALLAPDGSIQPVSEAGFDHFSETIR